MKYTEYLLLILCIAAPGYLLPTADNTAGDGNSQTSNDTVTESTSEGDSGAGGEGSEEDIATLENYMFQFTPYVKEDLDPAASVGGADADGKHYEAVPAAETPVFKETVISMQKMMGLKPTGNVTKELVEQITQPRCGIQDPVFDSNAPGEYKVNTIWKDKYDPDTGLYPVTYSIFKEGFPKGAKFPEFERGLIEAMCTWELISNIRFKYVGFKKATADVTVKFETGDHGDGYPFDGSGRTLAHAFYPNDGRLHMDAQEPWYSAKHGSVDFKKKDFYTVALHELGHTIGLLHSDVKDSVMAPFYKYFGYFNSFEMPNDEWEGVAEMYGKRMNKDPASEAAGACRDLKNRLEVAVPPKEEPQTTEAVFEEFEEASVQCADAEEYKATCPAWKARGYCERTHFVQVMQRRCLKTCAFCPGPIPRIKSPEKVSSVASTICDISTFDSMSTVYDESDGFFAYLFKDDYYFKSKLIFSTSGDTVPSLLSETAALNRTFKWVYDPKTFRPGLFKFQMPDFLAMSERVDAMLTVGTRFIAFDGQLVHTYSRKTPVILHEETIPLHELFPGYLNPKVDAAYIEDHGPGESPTYSLFYGAKIWQFKEAPETGTLDEEAMRNQMRSFVPILDRQDVEIVQWHGVAACNVDSVFSYKGIPYFLKGNTFWPALDTMPQTPRDITYNFLRCWQEEPETEPVPASCAQAAPDNVDIDDDGPGGGAEASKIATTLNMIVATAFAWSLILLSST